MGYEREMSARQKALDLSKKKEAIEAEMDALFESLTVRNHIPTSASENKLTLTLTQYRQKDNPV